MRVLPEIPSFEIFIKPVTISINLFTSWRLTTTTNEVTLFMKLNLIWIPNKTVSNMGHGQAHLIYTVIIVILYEPYLTSAH